MFAWRAIRCVKSNAILLAPVMRFNSEHPAVRARLAAAGAPMCYIKLMLILRILNEMAVCRIEDVGDGILTYEITPDAPHTSVEASPLLRSLRERCGKGTAPA